MNSRALYVLAAIYFVAALGLAMAAVFNVRRGVPGFVAALAAGAVYAVARGVMVIRKARRSGRPGAF